MRTTVQTLALGFFLTAALVAIPAAASQQAPAPGLEAPSLTILEGSTAAVTIPWAEVGDTVEVAAPGGLEGLPAGDGSWIPAPDGRGTIAFSPQTPGPVSFELDLAGMEPGQMIRVSLLRPDIRTGDQLQANRAVRRNDDGELEIGGGTVVRVRHMVELRLDDQAARSFPTLERVAGDRYRLRETDPTFRLARLQATEVQHLIQATVTPLKGPETKASVSASTGWDAVFTNYPCPSYFGSLITITSAPGGSVVTSFDVQYQVYHSVDVSRFRTAIWHKDPPGSSNWTDFTQLYNGTASGSNTYNGSSTGRHEFDGSLVNTDYTVSCCNIYGAEYGYLDSWTLTLYYSGGTGIDLVADSVNPMYSTVAAGGTTGLLWSAHVGGSGTVGSSFETGIYLSNDATITTGDQLLKSRTQASGLNAGDSFGDSMFETLFTLPSGTTPGNYWIGILVDRTGAVTETSEGNNALATSLTVVSSSGLPNLVSSDCSVSPTHANAGDTVTLSYRWRNTGATGAPSFVWAAFLSSNSSYDAGDQLLMGLDALGGWPAGYDGGIKTMNVDLPASLADGTYYLGTMVDQGNVIIESSESDNWCTAALTVGSGGSTTTRWLIPASASSPGFGTSNWKTQLAVVNPDSATHQVTVYYVAKGAAWPGVMLVPPTNISPGHSLFLDDPLLALNPTTGLMYVDCDGQGPVVTTRTFNLATGGATYGQGIPALNLATSYCHSFILPMMHSVPNQFHTNIGLVQADSGSVTYRITLYSASGAQLGTKTYTRTTAYEQINDVFDDMGLGGASVQGGWARVEVESGCPFYWTTYASVVDDRTGDPTYVMPVAE